MSSKPFRFLLWSLFLGTSAVGLVVGHLENERLRRQLTLQRQQGAQAEQLRAANEHTRDLTARVMADPDNGAQAIHADLGRIRAEVKALEIRASEGLQQLVARAAKDATSLADNHDPERGLTRLEHFQNVGQTTPAAAFQTFVWAALKGEDAQLAGMIAFDGAAREKAESAVAALPAAARANYETPEKLAALFFASVLTGTSAAEITEVTFQDGQRAVIGVRGLTDRTETIPMHLGTQGWQIIILPTMADKLFGWARDRAPPPEK